MTEAEWLNSVNLHTMLAFLLRQTGPVRPTKRKLRLVACALAAHAFAGVSDPDIEKAIKCAELVTDGKGLGNPSGLSAQVIDWLTSHSGYSAVQYSLHNFVVGRLAPEDQAWVLREIFMPFRPVTIASTWLTSTVISLARAIYEGHRFQDMPILADALEDAGCDNVEILTHCRQPGQHVRGCWAVDSLLGKK